MNDTKDITQTETNEHLFRKVNSLLSRVDDLERQIRKLEKCDANKTEDILSIIKRINRS